MRMVSRKSILCKRVVAAVKRLYYRSASDWCVQHLWVLSTQLGRSSRFFRTRFRFHGGFFTFYGRCSIESANGE